MIKKIITCLILGLFLSGIQTAKAALPDSLGYTTPEDSLMELYASYIAEQLSLQVALNQQNDREGKSELNQYVLMMNPEDNEYVETLFKNQGQTLWQGWEGITDYMVTKNGDMGDKKLYLIIASVYDYYYDVHKSDPNNPYQLFREDVTEDQIFEAQKNGTITSLLNRGEEEEKVNKFYQKILLYKGLEELDGNDRIKQADKLYAFADKVYKLIPTEKNTINVCLVITLYDWDVKRNRQTGELEKTESRVEDYFFNKSIGSEYSTLNSFPDYILEGNSEEWETLPEIEDRIEKTKTLMGLYFEYYQLLEKGELGDKTTEDVEGEIGRAFVAMMLGWPKDGFELNDEQKRKINEVATDINRFTSLRVTFDESQEDKRILPWKLYEGFLRDILGRYNESETSNFELFLSDIKESSENSSFPSPQLSETLLNHILNQSIHHFNPEKEYDGIIDEFGNFLGDVESGSLKPEKLQLAIEKGFVLALTAQERVALIKLILETGKLDFCNIEHILATLPEYQKLDIYLLKELHLGGLKESILAGAGVDAFFAAFGDDSPECDVTPLLEDLGVGILNNVETTEEDKSLLIDFFDFKQVVRDILRDIIRDFIENVKDYKINEEYWNPCQFSEDTRKNIDLIAALPLEIIDDIFPEKIREYIQKGKDFSKSHTCFENPQLFYIYWVLAYYSGVYNELLDEIASSGEMAKLTTEAAALEDWLIKLIFDEETQEEFIQTLVSVQSIEKEDVYVFGDVLLGETRTSLEETINYYTNFQEGALYRIAYTEGRIATFIASFFVGLGEIKALATGAKLTKSLGQVLGKGKKLITESSQKISKLLREGKNASGKPFLKVDKQLKDKDKLNITDQNGNPVAKLREDGKLEITTEGKIEKAEKPFKEGEGVEGLISTKKVEGLISTKKGELTQVEFKTMLVEGAVRIILNPEPPSEPNPEEDKDKPQPTKKSAILANNSTLSIFETKKVAFENFVGRFENSEFSGIIELGFIDLQTNEYVSESTYWTVGKNTDGSKTFTFTNEKGGTTTFDSNNPEGTDEPSENEYIEVVETQDPAGKWFLRGPPNNPFISFAQIKKQRKYQVQEKFAYDYLISDDIKAICTEAQAIGKLIDYEEVGTAEVANALNDYLYELVNECGKKFDVIEVSSLGTSEFGYNAPFIDFYGGETRDFCGQEFQVRFPLILNADLLQGSLDDVNDIIEQTSGLLFVAKNLQEALTHEYGHRITYPDSFESFKKFKSDTDTEVAQKNYFNDGRPVFDVWTEVNSEISYDATVNGRELLAEIFTLYKQKGIDNLKPAWIAFFNRYAQACNICKTKTNTASTSSSLDAVEGLAKWALQVRGDPEIPNTKGTVWISWVFNEDGDSMGKYEGLGKPYLKNLYQEQHAEEAFEANFRQLKAEYEAYSCQQVEQVDLLVKRSPCANPSYYGHHCTNLILDLQRENPDITFKVYFMDLFYGKGNDQEDYSLNGIETLNNAGIYSNFFIDVLNRRSQYYEDISEYTLEIKRE